MKKVNEFEIKINKAIITGISVELGDDGEATWNISGKLITDKGMAISNFSFSNQSWCDESKKIEIPVHANMLGRDLFITFTPVILEKLGNMFKALPAPKK